VIHLLEIRKVTPDCTSPEPDHRRSPWRALWRWPHRHHDQNGSPENQHQALTGYLGAPIKLTDAQTIELSAGTTGYTSIAGDGPALVLLRGWWWTPRNRGVGGRGCWLA